MDRSAPVLLITARNAEAATGLSWRSVRREAAKRGLPLLGVGRKLAVRADAFLAALEVHSSGNPVPEQDDASQRSALRVELGLRLVGGRES